jgi:hypothetical protein
MSHAATFAPLAAFSDGDGELVVLLLLLLLLLVFFVSRLGRSMHVRVLSLSPIGHCALRRRAWVANPLARGRDVVVVGESVRGVIDGMAVIVRSLGRWGVDIGLRKAGVVSGEGWWPLRGIRLLGGVGRASDISSWARVG